MSKPIDDPRLTAYALGELPDSERHEIESLLRDSTEAREWVEEVRETGDELRNALQSSSAAIDGSGTHRFHSGANFAAPAFGSAFAGTSLRRWLHITRMPLAVAASLIVTLLIAYPLMTPQLSRSRGIASRDRVASSQREQERSEYKEVIDEISAGRKQYAQAGKDVFTPNIRSADMDAGGQVDRLALPDGSSSASYTLSSGGLSDGSSVARQSFPPGMQQRSPGGAGFVADLDAPAQSSGLSDGAVLNSVNRDLGARVDFRENANVSFGYEVPEQIPRASADDPMPTATDGALAGTTVDAEIEEPEEQHSFQQTGNYKAYNARASDLEPLIAEVRRRAVSVGTSVAPTDAVATASLLRREDGSPDTRPFSRLGFTLGDPGSPGEMKGDPFYGGNWLIGGNLSQESAEAATREPPSAEAYAPVVENPFLLVEHQPLSTFSIDVDTASYANVRRFLNQGQLPPPDAVRIEEMINYFTYDYPQPTDGHPFATTIEVAECPWAPNHRLARIGVQGEIIAPRERPAANLVFLVDVSGSMGAPNKLQMVKESLWMLLDELNPRDRVAVVTYAGTASVALTSTSMASRDVIFNAVDGLQAGGSTNGASGITMAYEQAEANFIEGGINRVMIATDGDFNVGVTSHGDLLSLIEEKAKSGVFLSVLGYGMGDLKDATLEMLADKGNGHYAYIDSIDEARRVLVEQSMGTLMTIAKDVKIQVEFNPAKVGAYRLVGYENRVLQAKDFNDDTKDAGEIGSGHSVTALYEIVPAGMTPSTPGVDPLKYQQPRAKQRSTVDAGQAAPIEGEAVADDGAADSDQDSGIAANGHAGEPGTAGGTRPTWFDGNDSDATGDAGELADGAEPLDRDQADAAVLNELLTVKLRYKEPDGDVSTLIEVPVTDDGLTLDDSSDDFAFAAAVASFGMLLRDSAHAESLTFDAVVELASTALGADESGERAEFTALVTKARDLRAAVAPPQ